MSNRFHTVNAPDYAHKFKCIGSDCPDTCCAGWRVDVDKATFKKIKALDDTPALNRIKSFFKVNADPDTLRHGFIQMEPGGKCPALTEQQLCDIQSELGEDYLSKTCQLYPRQFSHAGDEIEMHLYLSCPEAARLCLESDTPSNYSPMDLSIPKGKLLPTVGGFTTKSGNAVPLKAFMFWQVRNLIFDLSSVQSLPLWELVLLVGFLCEKLQNYFNTEAEPQQGQVEMLVLKTKLAALDGSFHQEIEHILPEDRVLGLRALYMQVMTNERMQLPGFKDTEFIDLVSTSFEGYNAFMDGKESSPHAVWSAPNAVIEKALRNFLRNEVGLDVFPRLQDPDLLSQWRKIVIKLSLVGFYLNGLSKFHADDFSQEHCIRLVQKFSKAISHNSAFLPRIDDLMAKAGIAGVAGLGILAR